MSIDPKLEHLRHLAETYSTPACSKTGTVYFQACPCCGTVRWTCSSPEPADDLTISVAEDFGIDNCRGCNEVRYRNPEVFVWVNNVVEHQIKRALEAERLNASLHINKSPQ